MADSLEDLLQGALADFDDLQPASQAVQTTHSSVTDASSSSTGARVPAENVTPCVINTDPAIAPSSKAAPRGLGLGGANPLARKPRKPVTAGLADSAASANPADALNQGSCRSKGEGDAGDASSKAGPKLSAEAQRLADDLMSLLQEAGMGEGGPEDESPEALTARLAEFMAAAEADPASGSASGAAAGLAGLAGPGEDDPISQLFGRMLGGVMPGAGGMGGAEGGQALPPPPPEFAAMMQQIMGGVGMPLPSGSGPVAATGGSVAGPSGSGAAAAAAPGDEDALSSSRLKGLAKQTLKTVSNTKKTRGHLEGGSAERQGGAAAAGGLPFGPGAPGGLGGLFAGLGSLGAAGGEGEGGAAGGVNMMVDYIMQHLLSKDVLYGPLKEIRDRYPPWLESHQGTLPPEEYSRYVAQYKAVQRVCTHYETAPSDFGKLMDLIQEMQTYGDPPGDIVEDMTGGAGRDLDSILKAADAEESSGPAGNPQPALEELGSELDKCKVQ